MKHEFVSNRCAVILECGLETERGSTQDHYYTLDLFVDYSIKTII